MKFRHLSIFLMITLLGSFAGQMHAQTYATVGPYCMRVVERSFATVAISDQVDMPVSEAFELAGGGWDATSKVVLFALIEFVYSQPKWANPDTVRSDFLALCLNQ